MTGMCRMSTKIVVCAGCGWGVRGIEACLLGRGRIIMNGNLPSKSTQVKDSRPCRRLIIRVMT